MKKTNILIILLFSLFIGIGVCSAVECVPDCTGKQCGDDGCGGSCGACLPDDVCSDGLCCPSGICATGENCPEDAPACPAEIYDTKCYEPTCISGCGKISVTRGETDEACIGSSGCNGHGCKCDGAPEPDAKCVPVLVDSLQFCRDIDITDPEDFTKPIDCIEPTSEFLTTDVAAYIIIKLSLLAKDDEFSYRVFDPSGAVIDDESLLIPQDTSVWNDYREVRIADQGLQPGTYTFKIYANGDELASANFVIVDEPDVCEAQGFYCCPEESTSCTSSKEGLCEEGPCCESSAYCETPPPDSKEKLTRTLITNCEDAGLNACNRVIILYEYNIHGNILPEQVVKINYMAIDVDCYDKNDVVIAYYDEEEEVWVEKNTFIEQVSEDIYTAKAQTDYVGYVALLRTDSCVPSFCSYGGYRTIPSGGYVNVGEPVTFKLCGMITECSPLKDNVCNKKCPEGIDIDCVDCSSEADDCCMISYDGKCDKDCAPYVDPDCCRKADSLCCAGGSDKSSSESCDNNCDTGGAGCTGCTAVSDDCCNANSDGACDPDCPKLSNGVGYLDIDCCASKGISIINNKGDCCNAVQDGVCDCDCIAGLDTDCVVIKDCCGNQVCADTENPSTCPADCYCGDKKCSSSEESCSSCPVDCGECPLLIGET